MKNKIVIVLIVVVLLLGVLFIAAQTKKGDTSKPGTNNSESNGEMELTETVSKSNDLDVLEKELNETVILEEDFSDL